MYKWQLICSSLLQMHWIFFSPKRKWKVTNIVSWSPNPLCICIAGGLIKDQLQGTCLYRDMTATMRSLNKNNSTCDVSFIKSLQGNKGRWEDRECLLDVPRPPEVTLTSLNLSKSPNEDSVLKEWHLLESPKWITIKKSTQKAKSDSFSAGNERLGMHHW